MGYRIHSLTLDADAQSGTPIHIPDIVDVQSPTNSELLAELVGAHPSPTHLSVAAVKPVLTITTFAIEDALDALGVAGMIIASDALGTGVKLNLAQLGDDGETLSGSNHRTINAPRGVIVPQRITIDNRGDARLEMGLYPIKKSGSAILVPADSAALPTIAIASKRWTMGDIDVGGTTLTDFANVQIDFGHNLTLDGTQSEPYDTHVAEKRTEPAITIRGIDPTWFTTTTPVPIGGVAATHANTFVYLRKRTQDGNHFVADATLEHIKFTLAGIGTVDDAIRGQAARIGETSLRLTGVRDSSGNTPLIVTTGVAHPA